MYLTGNDIRQEEKFNLDWFFYHGESAPEQPGSLNPVSYTHLDVYKRQEKLCKAGDPHSGHRTGREGTSGGLGCEAAG